MKAEAELAGLELSERRAQWAALLAEACALAWALETWALLPLGILPLFLAPWALRRGFKGGPTADLLVAAVGVALGVPLGLAGGEPAPGLAAFLLVAQTGKLLAPRGPRDLGLAQVVGIVLVGVAAAEGVEPMFGLLLLVAVALTLRAAVRRTRLELARQVLGARPTAPALGGALPRGVGQLFGGARTALFLAMGTLFIFFCFPRFGPKLLPARRQSAERLSGFTDEVGLEDIGRIKRSDQLAFRVELPSGTLLEEEGPYWRGTALDTYDGSTWRRSENLRLNWNFDASAPGLFVDRRFTRPRGDPVEATVYLEAIGSRYLFGPGAIDEVTFKTPGPRQIQRDIHGGMSIQQPAAVAMAYRVRSWPGEISELNLRPSARELRKRNCLHLPDKVDRARLREYADTVLRRRRVPQDAPPSRVAQELSDHLARTFGYTVEGSRTPGTEPVEDFLFTRKTGHCEVFASALTVLLRTKDVPCRLVTGFRGGDFNDWSGTWTVRQREAHAWVEALIEGERWKRLDPTPASESGPRGAFSETIEQLGDWAELRWFQYVIAFDAYDQRNFLFWLEDRLRSRLAQLGFPRVDARRVLLAFVLAGLGTVILLALRLGWGRSEEVRAAPRGSAALRRLLESLRRHGLSLAPGETVLELSRRAEARLGEGAAGLRARVPGYYAERFGGRPPDGAEAELTALAAKLDALPAAEVKAD